MEEKLRLFADAQHGLVTRAQLLGAGVSSAAIERRLRNGTLLPEYPGIYRVGHRAPSMEASYLAAVLACGKGSLLSGRAAGHLLGLLKGAAPGPEVATATERRVEGIRTRRSRRAIDRRDAMLLRAIPVTTVVVLARRPNSRGAAKLQRILRGDVHITLSKLEARFLELLHEAELPLPQTNRPAGGRRVDCRWPRQRLTVELDSYRYHHSRHAWEQDRHREREARARGDEVRRYTYGDVLEHPRLMLRELRELLSRRSPA